MWIWYDNDDTIQHWYDSIRYVKFNYLIYKPCSITHDFRPLRFFLCFRWARALDLGRVLPKNIFSPVQRAHWIVADYRKKHVISGNEKKKFRKNKFISSRKKFQLCFFVFFLSSPSLLFFLMGFIWSPLLTFPKIGLMGFFSNVFTPFLINFWFISDLKQKN